MSKLRRPLRHALGETQADDSTLARVWAGVQSRGERSHRAWLVPAAVAASVLVIAAVIWSRVPPTHAGGPLMLADGQPLPRLDQPVGMGGREVSLSDGSQLTLAPGAMLETLENTGERFNVLLKAGRVRFAVHPHGPRRWIIDSGPVTVEVVGTRFVVDRETEATEVDVEEGIVLVRGDRVPGRVQRLTMGQSLRVSEAPAAPSEPPLQIAPSPSLSPAPSPAVSPARGPGPRASIEPAWEKLGREHKYVEARAALGDAGIASIDLNGLHVDALMDLADITRRAGHPEEAVHVLGRVADHFPTDPTSALAAFTQGRIERDELHRPAQAASAFGRALELGLPNALQEDALSALIESRAHAGDARGAQAAFQDYVSRYPRGRDRATLQQLLGPQ